MMREPIAVFFQVIMPVAFAALGIWLGTLSTERTVEEKRILNFGELEFWKLRLKSRYEYTFYFINLHQTCIEKKLIHRHCYILERVVCCRFGQILSNSMVSMT